MAEASRFDIPVVAIDHVHNLKFMPDPISGPA